MLIVGVTGGIGSGKSTVAAALAGCGARVISADREARRLLWRSGPCFAKVVRAFGAGILTSGRIDRRKLADAVFSRPARLRRLEAILHPAVKDVIFTRCARWRKQKRYRVVVLDVPLLFEAGWDRHVDVTVVARATGNQQIRRAADRLKLSRREVRLRISAQMPLSEKSKRADIVIDNRGSKKQTLTQVRRLWQDLLRTELKSTARTRNPGTRKTGPGNESPARR
jgi:dephospho-CoA kinase